MSCFSVLTARPALAVPTIQITNPGDQASVNPTGGPPDLVTVTYLVTGNTCLPNFKKSFQVAAYVNGVQVDCSGDCGCDATTDVCDGFTGTITLAGSAFSSCLNTIQLKFNPSPYCPTACNTPCSTPPVSNTVQVWQSKIKDCTPPKDCNRGTVGKPVDVASGDMYHEMTDLRIQGPLPIEFSRRYDSQSTFNGPMGFGWQHSFLVRLEAPSSGQEVFVDRQARHIYFPKKQDGTWDENRIDHLVLSQPGTPPWRVTDKFQTKWNFDAGGHLTQISDRTFTGTTGNTITLTYTGSNLTAITDAFGRVLSLTYYGTTPDRIHTISAGGRTVTYTYNTGGNGNLERVDFPDSSFVTYEYNDPNDAHRLTAVKDATSPTPHVIESHTYYGPGDGAANGKVHTTQSDAGNYAYTLVYDSPSAGQTTVTNSLGTNSVYTFDDFKGVVTQSTGPGCASCGTGGTTTTLTYDAFLNVSSITDGRGVVTQFPSYDGKGNVLTRIDAVGTGRQRTTTYTYDPTYNFVHTITVPSVGTGACLAARPNKVVTNTYRTTPAPNGDLMERKVEGCQGPNDPTDFFTNITSYDYDSHGQLAMVNGPLTAAVPDDVTTYLYYADADSDVNKRGRLQRVTNALGHQTNYASHDSGRPPYDLFGNVKSVIDANDVETQYEYDGKDRVTSTTLVADAITTENQYDLVGNLHRVRLPNCVEKGMVTCPFTSEYVYDTVNRLKEVHDAEGNKIIYTYDTEGNRTREEYQDVSAVVQKFTNFKFDTYNRLQYTYFTATIPEGGGSIFYKYTYFDDGTRASEQDPLGHITSYDYDELKRLKTVTQTVSPNTLTTTYGYDAQDNLQVVIDPSSFQTTYTNSDLGWRLTTTSPDTGLTSYTYDPAGNLTATTDAIPVTVNRTYDSLNRLLTVTYPTSSLNVSYTYDAAESPPGTFFNVGRRTNMTDPSGSSAFHYNRRGLLQKEEKTIGSRLYTTQYSYDKTGNLTQVLYPTENSVLRQGEANYQYDDVNRVSLVTTKVNGVTTTVANGFAYEPFGPRTQSTFNNGLRDTRTYGSATTKRYQLNTWTLGSSPAYDNTLNYTHAFNDDLNLTGRTDNPIVGNNRTFDYDEIHRLKSSSGPWCTAPNCTTCASGTASYTYDLNGNRQCKGEAATPTTYLYVSGKNRLASETTGASTKTYASDNNGNVTGDGTHTYQYSDADRLATVDTGTTAKYTHDGDGRRIIKTVGNSATYFLYDPSGKLLTEASAATAFGKDYLYLRDQPVARVDWTSEVDLGNYLKGNKNSPNVRLDWLSFPSAPNVYVVRRKQVVNSADKTFNGNAIIATVNDPTEIYDDPVLNDGNRYDYVVSRKVSGDGLFFYHTDHLGTPIAMTDGTGSLVWRAEFRPFGDGTPTGPSVNNLRFSGQYFDGESGLHQNWYRDYSPRIGRYFEPDPYRDAYDPQVPNPTADSEAFSFYPYVRSNPTTFIDPLGLLSFKGCLQDQENALRAALKDYCNKANEPGFQGCMYDKPSIIGRVQRICNDDRLTIRCKQTESGQCLEAGAIVCGWSLPFGRTIRICPGAWKPPCPSLGCTLLHEITHEAGHPFERWPLQVEACLGCK